MSTISTSLRWLANLALLLGSTACTDIDPDVNGSCEGETCDVSDLCKAVTCSDGEDEPPLFLEQAQARILLDQVQGNFEEPAILFNVITARFFGVRPATHEETLRQDACRVLTRTDAPPPRLVSTGTLIIRSGADEFLVPPQEDNAYQFRVDRGFLVPPGETLTAASSGDGNGLPVLSEMAADAVDFLRITSPADSLVSGSEEAVTLTWSEPEPSARVRLAVRSPAGDDGLSRVILECDAPDTGALEVPQAVVSEFADFALDDSDPLVCSECPGELVRYHRDSSELEGMEIELRVETGRALTFSVD